MKTPEHERLLHDVLSTSDYSAFRAELAKQLRHQVGQRRSNRWTVQLALAASLILLGVILLRPTHRPVDASYRLVRTSSLDAAQLVRTSIQPMTHVRTITGFAQLVTTATHARPVTKLTDDQLLSLFPKTPVALVSDATGHQQLVFLDPAGPKIFQPGQEDEARLQ